MDSNAIINEKTRDKWICQHISTSKFERFCFLAPCPSSGLFVHGDKDNIASFDSTKILVEKLQKQKKVDINFAPIKGADHFYENFSNEFEHSIKNYISKIILSKN